ncbi:MAG TPA: NdvB, partial [Patescibacteria group bacterium]|nr:NdvB [Patescibacteria group bacterium]
HGAVWAMKAYAMMKNGDKAYELFNTLNPINRTLDRDSVNIYKSEPYVMAGDIYSNPQHLARGGWSWYTGSAGWLYRVAIEDILGFKVKQDYFTLEPVLPKEWTEYEMIYSHNNTLYSIKVERGEKKGLYINGNKTDDSKIYFRSDMGNIDIYLVI